MAARTLLSQLYICHDICVETGKSIWWSFTSIQSTSCMFTFLLFLPNNRSTGNLWFNFVIIWCLIRDTICWYGFVFFRFARDKHTIVYHLRLVSYLNNKNNEQTMISCHQIVRQNIDLCLFSPEQAKIASTIPPPPPHTVFFFSLFALFLRLFIYHLWI